jgi:replicative DNA helicase
MKKNSMKKEAIETEINVKTISDFIVELNQVLINEGNTILTGFETFDQKFGGFNAGELIVIGGRPNMGKTQFLVNLSLNIAEKQGVLYITSELSDKELFLRFVATLTGTHIQDLLRVKSSKKELKTDAIKKQLKHKNLFLSEHKDIETIKVLIKQQVKNNHIKIVFIDCLQLINQINLSKKKKTSLGTVLTQLKELAEELKICIVTTNKLGVELEMRGSSYYPQLSDLMDKGISEKIASKIILMFRAEYYGFMFDEEDRETKGLIELNVTKNKTGPIGKMLLKKNDNFTHLSEFK